MTAFMPRGMRWLEIGAILALFLVIHVTANETGKLDFCLFFVCVCVDNI